MVIPRQAGLKVLSVSGDPCIAWDDEVQGWRMVFFYDPPGHAQAVCLDPNDLGPGHWQVEGPIPVTNPEVVGRFHKPFLSNFPA